MSEQKRYRAGAIGRTGSGDYGHGLHLGFLGAEQVDFVVVADPDEAGRQKVAEVTGAERTYADYREMLEKEGLDLVTVGPRWVDCHEEMVTACVEAGCHVYCEKPMAASLEAGDRMVAAADRAGVKLAVAHQGVYLPQVQEVKRLLQAGPGRRGAGGLRPRQTGQPSGWGRRYDGAGHAPVQHDAVFRGRRGLDVCARDRRGA